MSESVIVFLMLLPILVVIALLHNASKKQKKKTTNKLAAYLQEVTRQTGFVPGYQKQLVHQLVVIDERNSALLIINYQRATLSHDLFSLDTIRNLKVVSRKEQVTPVGKGQKPESFTTQIGIEMTTSQAGAEKFLTLYNQADHSIYQMAGLEKEAWQLYERIKKYQTANQFKHK